MAEGVLHREAVRYAAPLREGGSLPAVVETEGGELFVVKFRGAGQGAPALVAELVVGLLAQRLGLTVPDLAVVEVGEGFGRAEPDPEIQDILRGSHGPNVGLRFLEGAFAYDPVAFADLVTPEEATDIVWFDALTLNVDRTPRNPNILVQHRRAWLIDHGAALYLHHDWPGVTEERVRTPFERIRDHVLLPRASSIAEADERLAPRLTDDGIAEVLAAVPDTLLMDAPEGRHAPFPSAEEARAAYHRLFADRLRAPRVFAEEAERARVEVQAARPRALDYRR